MKFQGKARQGKAILFLILMLSYSFAFAQLSKKCVTPPHKKPKQPTKTLCEENQDFVPDFIFEDVVFASTLENTIPGFGVNSYSGKDIEIRGTLYIDIPFGFQNCNLKMGNNAAIVILEGNKLLAGGTNFFACANMWQGILNQHGGEIVLFSCRIEDARNAISAEDNTILSLYSNQFNRNIVGIRNTNATTSGNSMQFDYFSNNLFTTTSDLNNGEQWGYAGIVLNNCVADIGSFSWTNTFNGLKYGIHAQESVVSVMGATFKNMIDDNGDGGVGIYTVDGSLSLGGVYYKPLDIIFGASSFENCDFAGISSQGTNLTVQNATFSNCYIGITSENNYYAEQVHLAQNTINMDTENCLLGIYLGRSTASGEQPHNTIFDNTITMDFGLTGIWISAENIAIDRLLIDNNNITVSETHNATNIVPIAVAGGEADRFIIVNNTIEFNCITASTDGGNGRWGIYMFDSEGEGHEISYNTITGSGAHNPGRCAIHLENTPNVYACTNTLDYTHRGIHINGDCDNGDFRNNIIQHHNFGLRIQDMVDGTPGVLGVQTRHGNTWLVGYDYPNWGAENLASPLVSKFLVESTAPNILPIERYPGGNEWFKLEGGTVNYCNYNASSVALSPKEALVVRGDAAALNTAEVVLWDMQRQLARKGLRNPQLANSVGNTDLMAAAFFNNNPSSYEKGAQMGYGLKEAILLDANTNNALHTLRAAQEEVFEQLALLNEGRIPPTDVQDIDENLMAAKAALQSQLLGHLNNEQNIQFRLQEQRQQDLQNLQTDNTWTPATEQEEAREQLYVFQAKKVLGTETLEDVERIQKLAMESPAVFGKAVTAARKYLPVCEQLAFMLPETDETKHNLSINNNREGVTTATAMTIYPNPAKDKATIAFGKEVNGWLKLYDTNGKQLLSRQLNENFKVDLKLDDIPKGFYFLRFESEAGNTAYRKLIID